MAATGPGSDDDGAEGLVPDLLCEGVGDLQRELVLGCQCAEGASHAAAAGVQQRDFALRQTLGQPAHEGGIHQRLRVAMGMDDDVPGFGFEPKRIRLMDEQLLNELLEEEATAGNALHPLQLEFAVILYEHGVARGLQEKDRRSVHVQVQQLQIVVAESGPAPSTALAATWGGPT